MTSCPHNTLPHMERAVQQPVPTLIMLGVWAEFCTVEYEDDFVTCSAAAKLRFSCRCYSLRMCWSLSLARAADQHSPRHSQGVLQPWQNLTAVSEMQDNDAKRLTGSCAGTVGSAGIVIKLSVIMMITAPSRQWRHVQRQSTVRGQCFARPASPHRQPEVKNR